VLDIAERLAGAVVEDDGRSVVDILLEVTAAKEVAVAEAVVDTVVDDDESTVLVDAAVLVTGVVTVVDKDEIVVGGVLETGLEVVVIIVEPSW
jgi:hypothetical protein